jgi:hypothetical protein
MAPVSYHLVRRRGRILEGTFDQEKLSVGVLPVKQKSWSPPTCRFLPMAIWFEGQSPKQQAGSIQGHAADSSPQVSFLLDWRHVQSHFFLPQLFIVVGQTGEIR